MRGEGRTLCFRRIVFRLRCGFLQRFLPGGRFRLLRLCGWLLRLTEPGSAFHPGTGIEIQHRYKRGLVRAQKEQHNKVKQHGEADQHNARYAGKRYREKHAGGEDQREDKRDAGEDEQAAKHAAETLPHKLETAFDGGEVPYGFIYRNGVNEQQKGGAGKLCNEHEKKDKNERHNEACAGMEHASAHKGRN